MNEPPAEDLGLKKFDNFVFPELTVRAKDVAHAHIQKGTSTAVEDAKFWILGPARDVDPRCCCCQKSHPRRLRDWPCLLIYVICLGLVLFFGLLCDATKVTNARAAVRNYLEPTDKLRRTCGRAPEDQPDPGAVDYTSIITRYEHAEAACYLFVDMALRLDAVKKNNARVESEGQGKQYSLWDTSVFKFRDYEALAEFDSAYCDAMFDARSDHLDKAKSQHFMHQLGKVYADTSGLDLGYKSSNMFCVASTMISEDNSTGEIDCRTSYLQKVGYPPTKICHTEMVDVLNYLMTFKLDETEVSELFN